MRTQRSKWTIDESKCMSEKEVALLRATVLKGLSEAIQDGSFRIVRRWFMLELGLHAGLRVAEMASLCHRDVFLDGDRSSIVVIGKGSKKRAIWVGSAFKAICQRFILAKISRGFDCSAEQSLLCSLKGVSITKRTLQKDFKKLLVESGLPSYYYIHCLRHTYTTFLLRASQNNYRFAQQQLGHSSIRTTQVYATVVESDGRQALETMYN